LVVVALAGLALAGYTTTESHRLHDPAAGLRQIDLLYLDEPAPLLDRVGGRPDEGALVIVLCEGCAAPALREDVAARVVVTDDAGVARAYGLAVAGEDGPDRIGPGYALVDDRGHVRYRSFDPRVSSNGEEIRVLVRALRGGAR
jgi:hypothetical protein